MSHPAENLIAKLARELDDTNSAPPDIFTLSAQLFEILDCPKNILKILEKREQDSRAQAQKYTLQAETAQAAASLWEKQEPTNQQPALIEKYQTAAAELRALAHKYRCKAAELNLLISYLDSFYSS